MGEVFFAPSCYAPKASNVRHVGPSREERGLALSQTHEHEIGEERAFRHRLSPIIQQLRRSVFHEKNYRLIMTLH